MFDDLDAQIEQTETDHPKTRDKIMRFAGVVILSVVVFGGLVAIILALE